MKLILLYSGNPLPAMLELGSVARESGKPTEMILVDRKVRDLSLDSSLLTFPVTLIESTHNGVSLRRLFGFPVLMCKVILALFQKVRAGDVVITNTLDMLAIANTYKLFCRIRIRHQVRDLVALQLGNSLASHVFRRIDKILVSKCDLLIYSAPDFYEKYYSSLYSGRAQLLENLPKRDIWNGFVPRSEKEPFVVAYLGIFRYMKPLFNLVTAIEALAASEAGTYFCRFAGGGDQDAVRALVSNPRCFEFSGRFEYARAIAKMHEDVNLIYAVYDKFDMNCQIAMPTKFYESLLSGIPILVSEGTSIGDLVESMGIGKAVNGEDHRAIEQVLMQATQPDSWYESARERLRLFDTNEIFHRYDHALVVSTDFDFG